MDFFFVLVFIPLISQINALLNEDIRIYEFQQNVNANVSFPGKRFVGHVIDEFSTKRQLLHCAYECLRVSRCRSFNYEHVSTTCQLNDADHVTDASGLVNEVNGTRSEYHLREAFSVELVSCYNYFNIDVHVLSITIFSSDNVVFKQIILKWKILNQDKLYINSACHICTVKIYLIMKLLNLENVSQLGFPNSHSVFHFSWPYLGI